MTWVDDIEHRAKAYESHPGGLRQLTRLDIPRLTEALREAMAVMEGALSDAICGCCARSVRSTREPLCRCSGPMKVGTPGHCGKCAAIDNISGLLARLNGGE